MRRLGEPPSRLIETTARLVTIVSLVMIAKVRVLTAKAYYSKPWKRANSFVGATAPKVVLTQSLLLKLVRLTTEGSEAYAPTGKASLIGRICSFHVV